MNSSRKRATAIMQARTGSTRFPAKVMMEIVGKPMLCHIIERLRLSQKIGDVILATTTLKEDDELEKLAKQVNLPCYRGEALDVLARYYGAATQFNAEVIVRICCDDPLIDPRITDLIIAEHLASGVDYTSGSGSKKTFPLGLSIEVFNFEALQRAYEKAKQDYEREHVTPYIYLHPELFSLKSVEATGKLRRPELRLTVDTEEDLQLIRGIFSRLYRDGQIFYTEDVVDLLDKHPELAAINAHVRQKGLGE